MKSITLFNPSSPWLISDRALVPLGILQLANYLRYKDIDVKFVDLSGEVYRKSYDIPKTDFYGVGFVSPQFIYAKEILTKIKEKYPNATVLAGGIHSTSMPKQVLDSGFDAVLRGEGEKTAERIIKEGLEKKIYEPEYVKDLDSLPGPAWDLVDLENYVSNIDVMEYMKSGNEEEREINIMGTRGCSAKCAYCTKYKGPLRWRSVEKIVDEVKFLHENYGVNRVGFCDDNIVVNKRWLMKLLPALKNTGVKFHLLGRADQIDYSLCKEMVDAGCMGIDFGIESGSQRMLDLIKKRTTVIKQENGIRAASMAGLKVRAQLMVGLPGETREDIKESINFIERNREYVLKWGVHVFVPFPSCEFWDTALNYGYKIDKEGDFSNFQTIGKPGEWNFVPAENQEEIARRRDELLNIIDKKNIFI